MVTELRFPEAFLPLAEGARAILLPQGGGLTAVLLSLLLFIKERVVTDGSTASFLGGPVVFVPVP